MASIVLDGVERVVDGHRILDGVDLVVDDGEMLGLIGPSGAGKTSIIRAIGGFDVLTGGRILFDGEDITDTPTRLRDLGVVFQENTLFPTHRVRANVSFPLRIRALTKPEIRKRVEAESRAMSIDHILERWPATLSGGEQKLAQIARALVRVPRVFLLDEPLADLDPPTRHRLREELLTLQRGYGVTTIYATNDPDEIMRLPDRVAAVERGRITQVDTPMAIHTRPVSLAIARLTGPIGTVPATVTSDVDGYWVAGDGIRLRAWTPALADHIGEPVTVGVRSHDVRSDPAGPVRATVGRPTFVQGMSARILDVEGGDAIATIDEGLAEGAAQTVRFDRWHVFAATGRRIVTIGA